MRKPWDALLDASIYFSFDASGFERHARRFDPDDLDVDLRGKTYLVTGANSGIGYATAEALAQRGARVHLLCRSLERGGEALDALRRATGNADLHLERVDLSDLAAIRRWVEGFAAPQVDALIHNAGLLPHDRELTPDGLELTFATHVVGPYLLTQLLRAQLEAAPAARVVWVSSGGMYTRQLSLDDLDWSRRRYDGVVAYAQTKRMQVVLNELFAERWSTTGVRFLAMHPGWAGTPGVESSLPGFFAFTKDRLRTPAQGADTVVWLAAAAGPGRTTGTFWFDRAQRSTHLLPGTRADTETRDALWTRCAKLTACPTPV